MKLVVAIVSNDDSHTVSNALNKANFMVTRLSTTGGFLKMGNTTLLIGTEDKDIDKVLDIVKEFSKQRTELVPSTAAYDIGRFASFPVEVTVGGATIFVVDVEQFIKI